MKKLYSSRLLVWVAVAALPLWLGSCSKNSDSVTPASASIEGTWFYSGLKIYPAYDLLGNGTKTNDLLALFTAFTGGTDLVTCIKSTKITFASGGKATATPGATCMTSTTTTTSMTVGSGTWKLDGSKLTLTDSSGATETYDTVVNGNTLTLSQQDSSTDYDGDGKKDTVTLTTELTKA